MFNAANEQAVAAFHGGGIGYLDILEVVERVVDLHEPFGGALSLESVLEAEGWARGAAEEVITRLLG